MNIKAIYWILILFASQFALSQQKTIVTISGYAPSYVGETIMFNEIQDYFSLTESTLASTVVKKDSTFEVSFFINETQKIMIQSRKNKSFMYVQPSGKYRLYIPDRDSYEPYRPTGNKVEITFFELDSSDVNYKILEFQRWMDQYIGQNYKYKITKPTKFAAAIDSFKVLVHNFYEKDTSFYVKTFIKFSLAALDNIQYAADRNRYEKHDFYIKNFPVSYKNDAYMEYISNFYEKIVPRLSMETNNRMYLALLKSSPKLIMLALGGEYTLKNLRIRELVMIKALSEEYYSKDYPQTNILTVLDSVANHSLFVANGIFAKNAINRLTELVPGGKAPDFVVKNSLNETKTLSNYKKKHLYIHFFNPANKNCYVELEPLKKMYETYRNEITFLTIYPVSKEDSTSNKKYLDDIPWEKCGAESSNSIWMNYKVVSYPHYVLIDALSYIVASPALSPMPNGVYQTIEQTFFNIQKLSKSLEH